jgi:hypothetical protein
VIFFPAKVNLFFDLTQQLVSSQNSQISGLKQVVVFSSSLLCFPPSHEYQFGQKKNGCNSLSLLTSLLVVSKPPGKRRSKPISLNYARSGDSLRFSIFSLFSLVCI